MDLGADDKQAGLLSLARLRLSGGLSRSYRLDYPAVRQGFGFAALKVDNMFAHHTPTPAQKRHINSLRNCARMLAREI
jgi:hypothetical protein